MNCPTCNQEIIEKPVLLKIRGKPMKIVKRTNTPKLYFWVDGENEVHRAQPIPVLIVEEV